MHSPYRFDPEVYRTTTPNVAKELVPTPGIDPLLVVCARSKPYRAAVVTTTISSSHPSALPAIAANFAQQNAAKAGGPARRQTAAEGLQTQPVKAVLRTYLVLGNAEILAPVQHRRNRLLGEPILYCTRQTNQLRAHAHTSPNDASKLEAWRNAPDF